MKLHFEATTTPTDERIRELAAVTPRSPFNSPAFAAASRARGATPCVLALVGDTGRIVAGAVALVAGSTRHARLEIPTAPSLPDPALFWGGVTGFCRQHGVSDLEVDTFASERPDMPQLGKPAHRRERFEYVIDLGAANAARELSDNHRRNLRRACRAGLAVTRTRASADAALHLAMMQASATRRRRRGEPIAVPADASLHAALLDAGAAELFRAESSGRVLSSLLVLRGETSAYYHSAGTNAEGMHCGASTFVVVETAKRLAGEGVRWFNVGGADAEAAGLRRFKHGLGADEVKLESVTYSMIPGYARPLRVLAAKVESSRRRLLDALRPERRGAGE